MLLGKLLLWPRARSGLHTATSGALALQIGPLSLPALGHPNSRLLAAAQGLSSKLSFLWEAPSWRGCLCAGTRWAVVSLPKPGLPVSPRYSLLTGPALFVSFPPAAP